MANAIVGTLMLVGIGAVIGVPIGVLSGVYMAEFPATKLATIGALRGGHAERRAVDRRRRLRLRHRGAAVQQLQRAGGRAGARDHDDPDRHPHHRGAAASWCPRRCARARWRSARPAAARSHAWCCRRPLPGIITGVVLALARIAGETAPLLFTAFNNRFLSLDPTQPIASLTGAGLHLRHLAVRGLASPGLGRRARAGHARAALLDPGAVRDPAARAAADRTVMQTMLP